MKRIKLNKSKVFIKPFFILTVLIYTGTVLFYSILKSYIENTEKSVFTLCLIILGICAFLYSLFYAIKKHFQKVPFVTFENNSLWINKRNYDIRSLSDIQLLGKFRYEKAYYYSSPTSEYHYFKEGMKFTTLDGKEVVLFDELYKNLYDLKIQLNKGLLNLKDDRNQSNQQNKTFRNSQFKKVRGYILWGLISAILIKTYFFNSSLWNIYGQSIVLIVISSIFFYHSKLMNFFILSNKTISIKKENIFWFQNSFELDDIYEVVLDYYTTPPFHWFKVKQLRIVLVNFEQRTYPASLLTKKNWEELEKELLDRGIKVRNERNINYT